MMHPMLNIAVRATCKAGNLIAKYYEMQSNIQTNQKERDDFITNTYETAKTVIVDTIRKSYPEHRIFVKENNEHQGCNKDIQWVVDPLDGVTNFIKRLPYFAVSLAVRIKNKTEIAVVYDPMRNELFTATRGCNAQLNGYRLRSSNVRNLNNTVLATGFPFHMRQYTQSYVNIFHKLLAQCVDFRHIGSASLDLAYVAAGRVDGYFECGLRPWDFIAGDLIARASGALVCDFTGGHDYLCTGNILAGNPRVVKAMLINIREELSEVLEVY